MVVWWDGCKGGNNVGCGAVVGMKVRVIKYNFH